MNILRAIGITLLCSTLPAAAQEISPARLRSHVEVLASPQFAGRLTGTEGERFAVEYAAKELQSYGFSPAGDNGTFLQKFDYTSGVSLGAKNKLIIYLDEYASDLQVNKDWRPLAFSQEALLSPSDIVFAGYGIRAPAGSDHVPAYDSYVHLDVKDKWVMVLRFSPTKLSEKLRVHLTRFSPLRFKAMTARDLGAKGIIFVSGPRSGVKRELVDLRFDSAVADSGLPAISVSDHIADKLLQQAGKSLSEMQSALDQGLHVLGFPLVDAKLAVSIDLEAERRQGSNVLARLGASGPKDLPSIVVGGHIDHLGHGIEEQSLAGESLTESIHFGADDNASGVAAVLEMSRAIKQKIDLGELQPKRALVIGLWSGEELGLLGSNAYVNSVATGDDLSSKVGAYVNLDMVGRLREQLMLQGIASAKQWPELIDEANASVGLDLLKQDETYLPTDSTSFYATQVPILSFFTGAHEDYHRPSDTPEKLNYVGLGSITRLLKEIVENLLLADELPQYQKYDSPAHGQEVGPLRVYLGTIPDYTRTDVEGLMLFGVSGGGPAEKAGLKAGDLVIEVGGKKVRNIYDYTYSIGALRVGEKVKIVVLRGESRRSFEVVPESRD